MHIHLPDSALAELYKDSLIYVVEVAGKKHLQGTNNQNIPVQSKPIAQKKWYLGDNKKHVVFIVNDPSAFYINDEWLNTLGKLLAACKLNLGDVAIVNQANTQVNLSEVKEQLQPTCVLMFNVAATDIQLPFTMPHYQVQQYGGCTFMTAPADTLAEITSDTLKAEKRKLWEKLKQIFNI